jgi:hypothetical protein
MMAMDEKTIEALVRRAGLEKALAQFPDDVTAAANTAEKVADRVRASSASEVKPSSEPWPPRVVVRP